MITVLAGRDGQHRLEDATGRRVGWVRGRAIGFRGMRSVDEVMATAVVAWPRLEAALGRHYFGRPPQEPVRGPLRLAHDGAYEWVTDGQRPLARLHRPLSDVGDGEFAIEFVLPSYATEGVAVAVAQAVGLAIRSHLSQAVDAVSGGPSERFPADAAASA